MNIEVRNYYGRLADELDRFAVLVIDNSRVQCADLIYFLANNAGGWHNPRRAPAKPTLAYYNGRPV